MASLLDYALTTVADVKESLGIASGDTTKDNLIIRKINQATLYIEGYCGLPFGYHFKETTYTNVEFDGSGGNTIVFPMSPVSTLTAFQFRDNLSNENSWDDVDASLYSLNIGSGVTELFFNSGAGWNRYRGTFTAGFNPIPADLAEAAVTLASFYVENSTSGTSVKKKTEGQRSIEYFEAGAGAGGATSPIEQLGLDNLLSRYIRYNIADGV